MMKETQLTKCKVQKRESVSFIQSLFYIQVLYLERMKWVKKAKILILNLWQESRKVIRKMKRMTILILKFQQVEVKEYICMSFSTILIKKVTELEYPVYYLLYFRI
jgi:hypothetical protein